MMSKQSLLKQKDQSVHLLENQRNSLRSCQLCCELGMKINNLGKKFFINLFLVILIFLIDRISKIYVIDLDKKFLGSEIFSSKFLNINLIWNEGIAFGLFSFSHNYIILLTILFINNFNNFLYFCN